MIDFNVWKDGKNRCLTFSYDDGVEQDRRLIELFDRYGMRATFHVNAGLTEAAGRIPLAEFPSVYGHHELAAHGLKHYSLTGLPTVGVATEILEDRKVLESLMGKPIVGLSYANGAYNSAVIENLKSCGIAYSRTVNGTNNFHRPEQFLAWHPTAHHLQAYGLCEAFLRESYTKGLLFYIWGHSYEFDRDNNWDLIEELCEKLGGHDDVWYATNIEIHDYIMAQRSLRISVDNRLIHNPTAIDVWVNSSVQGIVKIAAGSTVKL